KRDSFRPSDMRLDWGLTIGSGSVYLYQGGIPVNFSYSPPTNTWTHLAVVATSTETRLYVNGSLKETRGIFALGTNSKANTVIGGTGEGPGGDNDPFKGSIDEVRIYNRAVSGSEALLIYNTYIPVPVVTLSTTELAFHHQNLFSASTSS